MFCTCLFVYISLTSYVPMYKHCHILLTANSPLSQYKHIYVTTILCITIILIDIGIFVTCLGNAISRLLKCFLCYRCSQVPITISIKQMTLFLNLICSKFVNIVLNCHLLILKRYFTIRLEDFVHVVFEVLGRQI